MMTLISRKLLRREDGYEIWQEISRPEFEGYAINDPNGDADEIVEAINDASGRLVTSETAYTPSGEYIGDVKRAEFLCGKKGIAPEPRGPDHVCDIGFCERDQKWYGWSHRAIYGFGIGFVASDGDSCCTSGWTDEWLKDHPDDLPVPVGFEVKTMEDAKRVAIAFAASVS